MADYSQVNDYSDKDALSTGNPLKLIKGSDVDAEFSAISTAIASKFDSTDIATAGEAQAGVSNTVVITPARLTAWAQNDAGVVEDLQALSDPGADRVLFWDDSAGTTTWLTLSTGLTLTGTTLTVDVDGLGGRTLTAGVGLSGGGDLSADRTFTLDLDELGVETGIAAGDFLAMVDITDSGSQKITFANVEAALNHDSLTGFVANEHIDHTAVTLTFTEGIQWSSGGTDISASATGKLDVNGLTTETTIDAAADQVVFYDASAATHRKVSVDSLVGDALGDGKWYKSTTTALSTSEVTVVFNTADQDNLQRGTFDLGAGTYTAGANGARVLVSASMVVPSVGSGHAPLMRVQKDGVDEAYSSARRNSAGDNTEQIVTVIELAASEVVRVRAGMAAGTATANSGISGMALSIVELA